ncbi:hypothetical protein, partial [Arthrobacter sp. H5]|uniref:hypothetical protein n=1 Tax=Arthrobacter sp. H5 TaxID=1267973 RepID=UPI001C1DEE19
MAERTGMRGVCGIDLGGSGCRAVVGKLDAKGSLSAGTMTEPVHRNVGVTVGAQGVDPNQLVDALEPAVRAAAAEAG